MAIRRSFCLIKLLLLVSIVVILSPEMSAAKAGSLIVISGPSGVGKGTICKTLLAEEETLLKSTSVTTRLPREGEKEGSPYFFRTKPEFERMIENDELIEWSQFAGNSYGVPRRFVEENIEDGKSILLEIDVKGALKVKEKYPDSILIFISPPSFEELERRLRERATESEENIQARLAIAKEEMGYKSGYDHDIINENVEISVEGIKSILHG